MDCCAGREERRISYISEYARSAQRLLSLVSFFRSMEDANTYMDDYVGTASSAALLLRARFCLMTEEDFDMQEDIRNFSPAINIL